MMNKSLSIVCAALLLQGCGLKGDLYLEEEPEATATEQEQTEQDQTEQEQTEQEQTEYLEENVAEETEEIGPEDDIFEAEAEEILDAP